MNSISIREFQQRLFTHLKALPLEVTRRGVPIFYVIKEKPPESKSVLEESSNQSLNRLTSSQDNLQKQKPTISKPTSPSLTISESTSPSLTTSVASVPSSSNSLPVDSIPESFSPVSIPKPSQTPVPEGEHTCEMVKINKSIRCTAAAIGFYRVIVEFDPVFVYLCKLHFTKAKAQTDVSEAEVKEDL